MADEGELFEDDGIQHGSQALHHVVGHQHVNLQKQRLGQDMGGWGRWGRLLTKATNVILRAAKLKCHAPAW
jgi:hypothetical protein